MPHKRIFSIIIISVMIFCPNLTGMEAPQLDDKKAYLSIPKNQSEFSNRVGNLAGNIFQKINNNWNYSSSTSQDVGDYLEHMNTRSLYWKVHFDKTYGIHFIKEEDIQASIALFDILECNTTIECERVIGFCLSITLCQIIGSDLYDLLYNNLSSPMRFHPNLSLQDTFQVFMADCRENNFCNTNKIGHWGYVLNASLYDTINESGFGEKGFGFGADGGFHLIVVKIDELGRGMYIGFSPELQKPISAESMKEFMIHKLYDFMLKASQDNSQLCQIINKHYGKEIIMSNEDITTSADLRKLIDDDYDNSNKNEISHFFDVNKILNAVEWARTNKPQFKV